MQAPMAPKKPMAPSAPPPRNPPVAVARLLQQTPAVAPPSMDAYESPVTEEKGGLPLEIVAYAQKVYTNPHVNPQDKPGANVQQLNPGWGGKGKA